MAARCNLAESPLTHWFLVGNKGIYRCIGICLYVLAWHFMVHASLLEGSSNLCSISSPTHPARKMRVCSHTISQSDLMFRSLGSLTFSRPQPIRGPSYIAMSAGSSRCCGDSLGRNCSPSDCYVCCLTNACEPRCKIICCVRDRVVDAQRL